MKVYHIILAITPLALAASPINAQVAQTQATPASTSAPANTSADTVIISLGELEDIRGGTQIAINNQTLNAENTGNSISGGFTAGDVNLADNALSDFNGLGNFVFNTGAQSSLQAGLSVTININD